MLGEHTILVEVGETAEFLAMIKHSMQAIDASAAVVMLFDREGKQSRLHHEV